MRNELAGIRETFESIGMAIIVAFVLRGFILEAFVIPTGSMAPQLMGAHVNLRCPDCGYDFPHGVAYDPSVGPPRDGTGGAAMCPICAERIPYDFRRTPIASGDRVLVQKFLYQFEPPQRYEVTVFRNPQNNRENYIKRLVGLPGEQLRLVNGDVFVRPLRDTNGDRVLDEHDLPAAGDWRVARKNDVTQEAMWQILFDNDYQPASWHGGFLDRQSELFPDPWRAADAADAWETEGPATNHGRVFRFRGGAGSQAMTFAVDRREMFAPTNHYNSRDDLPEPYGDVVSDLKLQATFVPLEPSAAMGLTLSALDHHFTAWIDLASGKARLLHRRLDAPQEPEQLWAEADVSLTPGRAVPVALTHADWQVTLWIDGKPVLRSDPDRYAPDVEALVQRMQRAGEARRAMFRLAHDEPQRRRAQQELERLLPTPRVALLGEGGGFELWHIQVLRDVYYLSTDFSQGPPDSSFGSYARQHFSGAMSGTSEGRRPGWGTMENPIVLRAFLDEPELDEFYMLGDNSPASMDSRLWVQAAPTLRLYRDGQPFYRLGTVPRYNLIGRAFFVYWPAGHRLPGTPLPIVPNVGRMRRIP